MRASVSSVMIANQMEAVEALTTLCCINRPREHQPGDPGRDRADQHIAIKAGDLLLAHLIQPRRPARPVGNCGYEAQRLLPNRRHAITIVESLKRILARLNR